MLDRQGKIADVEFNKIDFIYEDQYLGQPQKFKQGFTIPAFPVREIRVVFCTFLRKLLPLKNEKIFSCAIFSFHNHCFRDSAVSLTEQQWNLLNKDKSKCLLVKKYNFQFEQELKDLI